MEGLLALLAAALAITPPSTSAATVPKVEQAGLKCPHSDGYLQGPFLPNEAAARRVYEAYRELLAPQHRASKGARVVVDDEGDHWSVFEHVPVRASNGKLIVVMGGGGLGMTLDKCSGAVLSASFQR